MKRSQLGLLACTALSALALGASFVPPAAAQTAFVQRSPNVRSFGDVYAANAQAITSATNVLVTGTAIVNTTVFDPGTVTFQGSTSYVNDRLRVMWSADVTKSTSGTGSCSIYLNGVAIARSLRTISFAGGENTIGGYVDLSYTGAIAPADPFNVGVPGQTQTVDLRCLSSDGAAFTINRAQVNAEERY